MKKVEGFPRLYERAGRYVFRAAIPMHLREAVGLSEFKRTLGTDSLKEAKRAWAQIDAEFEQVKANAQSSLKGVYAARPSITKQALHISDIEALVSDWHAFRRGAEFEVLRGLSRSDRTGQQRLDAIREEMEGYADLRHWKLRQSASDVIDHLCDKHNFEKPKEGGAIWNRFADRIMEARVDVSRRVLARMNDDFSSHPANADVSFVEEQPGHPHLNPGSNGGDVAADALLLGEQIASYVNDRGRSVSDATRRANRGRLRVLAEYFGKGTDIRSITQRQMEAFRDTLLDLPRDPFRSLPDTPVAEMPAVAKARGLPIADRNNARMTMETASSFLRRFVQRGLLARDPCVGLTIKKDPRAPRKRRSFTAGELQSLFDATPYSIQSDAEQLFDGAYWVPLIALLSGMRLAEICQLWTDDIAAIDGIMAIRVKHDPDRGQRLKTNGSERIIPVHSELARLGLDRWATHRTADGPERLFPDIPISKSGSASDVFSKRFSYRMKRLGLTGRGLVFHSFRHTFVDAMRNCGLDDATQKTIGGWAAKDVHSQYGSGPNVGHLKKAIDKVRFKDAHHDLTLQSLPVFDQN
ncbi:site-specific integrase [Hyphobacterium sp. CCMP332]|uniref:site-specific integrase n=1 Tax=Hyphobacterium sp. CCMP332 TaxID=2749086 RepID=UPI001650B23F|nr:site-specific integrase [Hyphobacterium sp. CCMP332]QNL18853.1 site-specific integrase [Hyphobacterium sp. CCMP332]